MQNNDYSDLDYIKKDNKGCLLPLLYLTVVVILIAALIVVLGIRNDAIIDILNGRIDGMEENGYTEELLLPVNDLVVGDKEPDRKEMEEDSELNNDTLPDHEQLEGVLYGWLVERIEDPAAIMVHTSALDDVEAFFERYDLQEDNVIVYKIESTQENMATVLFGLPYSEWSLKVFFIWQDGEWQHLREEPFN